MDVASYVSRRKKGSVLPWMAAIALHQYINKYIHTYIIHTYTHTLHTSLHKALHKYFNTYIHFITLHCITLHTYRHTHTHFTRLCTKLTNCHTGLSLLNMPGAITQRENRIEQRVKELGCTRNTTQCSKEHAVFFRVRHVRHLAAWFKNRYPCTSHGF